MYNYKKKSIQNNIGYCWLIQKPKSIFIKKIPLVFFANVIAFVYVIYFGFSYHIYIYVLTKLNQNRFALANLIKIKYKTKHVEKKVRKFCYILLFLIVDSMSTCIETSTNFLFKFNFIFYNSFHLVAAGCTKSGSIYISRRTKEKTANEEIVVLQNNSLMGISHTRNKR